MLLILFEMFMYIWSILTLVLDLFHHNHPSMVEGRNILWYDYLTATPDNPWPYKVELLVITISYAFYFNDIASRKIHTSKIRQYLRHKSVRVRLPLRLTDHWVLFDNSSSVNTTFCHKLNTLWERDYHHHPTWGNWKNEQSILQILIAGNMNICLSLWGFPGY